MKFSIPVFLFLSLFAIQSSAAESEDTKQQIKVGKLYYQKLLDNKPEESYELLSSKDKQSFTKEQFSRVIALRTAVLNKNRLVTIKDATVTEADENMAVVQVVAELNSQDNQAVKTLKATQLLLKENGQWKVYSAPAITSILMNAKHACDTDTAPISEKLKQEACNVYYGSTTASQK